MSFIWTNFKAIVRKSVVSSGPVCPERKIKMQRHGKRLIRQSCCRRRAFDFGELNGFDIFALFFINSLSHQNMNETLIRLVIHEYRISGNVAGRLSNYSPWIAHLDRPMQTQSIRRSKPPPPPSPSFNGKLQTYRQSLNSSNMCVIWIYALLYIHVCLKDLKFKRSGNPNILK